MVRYQGADVLLGMRQHMQPPRLVNDLKQCGGNEGHRRRCGRAGVKKLRSRYAEFIVKVSDHDTPVENKYEKSRSIGILRTGAKFPIYYEGCAA